MLACGEPEPAGALGGCPELDVVTDADALSVGVGVNEGDALSDADGLEDPALGLGDRLGA